MKNIHFRILFFFLVYFAGYYFLSQPLEIAVADPGELMTDFGVDYDGDGEPDGYYKAEEASWARDFLIHSNGKLYIVGGLSGCSSASSSGTYGMLSRMLTAGTLDSDFGTDGVQGYNYADSFDFFSSVSEHNENIVAAGYRTSSSQDQEAVLVKYDADGGLVESFGTLGVVAFNASTAVDRFEDLVIDPSGNIIVVGMTEDNGQHDALVAKYDSSGNPVSSFVLSSSTQTTNKIIDGVYSMPLSASAQDQFYSVTLVMNEDSSDYSLYFAGYAMNANGDKDAIVIKTDSSGNFDSSFGGDGIWIYDHNQFDDVARDILVDSSGDVFVAGSVSETLQDSDAFVAKIVGSTGLRDESFGESGVKTHSSGNGDDDIVYSIALDAADNILLAGAANDFGLFFVARILPTGELDTSFGDPAIIQSSEAAIKSGYTVLDLSELKESFSKIKFDSDGNILVVGEINGASSGAVSDTAAVIAKYEGGFGVCGDGNISSTEECDDGNQAALDGCSATCTLEVDADGDGYFAGINDCNDSNPAIYDDGDCSSVVVIEDVFSDQNVTESSGGCSLIASASSTSRYVSFLVFAAIMSLFLIRQKQRSKS